MIYNELDEFKCKNGDKTFFNGEMIARRINHQLKHSALPGSQSEVSDEKKKSQRLAQQQKIEQIRTLD